MAGDLARRHHRRAGVVALVALVALSSATTVTAAAQYDCAAGCPLSAADVAVCGDDGLVYAGECLAACAGARPVACGGGGPSPTTSSAAAAAAAAAPGGLSTAAPPPPTAALGRMLDLSASSAFAVRKRGSGGGGGTLASSSSGSTSGGVGAPAFTAGDIQRYAGEGFALLGPANIEAFKPRPLTVAWRGGDGGGGNDQGSAGPSSSDVRALRVASDTGLLYATTRSSSSFALSAADDGALAALLSGGGSPPRGWRPARATAAASNSNNNKTAAAAAATTSSVPRGPGMNRAAWLQITTSAAARKYPYSAVAAISVGGWGCSGARISKWAVLTAGHCVYDFERGRLQPASSMRVHMARFVGSNGRVQSPYRSSVNVRSYTYFKDFAKGMEFTIGGLDVAVLQLASDPGNTGTLGLMARDAPCGLARCSSSGSSSSSYEGSPPPSPPLCQAQNATCETQLDSAAYPGETSETFGQLFRYRERARGRATLDLDAQDGMVSSSCFTPDTLARPVLPRIEAGMSGSGLWAVGGTTAKPRFRIVGVLSGLEIDEAPQNGDPYTCSNTFWYTEVTTQIFDVVVKAAADYDRLRGRAAARGGGSTGV